MTEQVCAVCGGTGRPAERAWVKSNVRAFQAESFEIWRCGACRSIHAASDVDLAHYYAKYPFHAGKLDGFSRAMYRNQLGRLVAAGLVKTHRILDYGCGNGLFVAFLRECGYDGAVGYDEFSPAFSDPKVLDATYDVVISQDVLEHAVDPQALLDRFGALVAPGGVLAIGTPDAGFIDLAAVERYKHALHAPYHRHLFAKAALLAAGERRGWALVQYFPVQYLNTWTPFVNVASVGVLVATSDGTIDAAFEPPTWRYWLWFPLVLAIGLFGRLLAPPTDVMAVFRTPSSRSISAP